MHISEGVLSGPVLAGGWALVPQVYAAGISGRDRENMGLPQSPQNRKPE